MKKGLILRTSLFCWLALLSVWGFAQESSESMTAEQFLASLNFQKGNITLPNKIATISLPDNFRYLSPKDAERILVDAWGNPPGYETLGMIVPESPSPIAENGWGVIVTYDEDGHVSDDDARTIKYDEILADMKKASAEDNKQRQEEGYPAMTLVGWAEPPSYDSATHKMYWAKELAVEGTDGNTLNYNIRVLGRQGVLVLNAVANMNQVTDIRDHMGTLVTATEFTTGNRYNDFNSSTDKVAEYGLAALLAGGVAAKTGFFAKLLAMMLAFKKLILAGVIVLGSFVSRFFGKKSG